MIKNYVIVLVVVIYMALVPFVKANKYVGEDGSLEISPMEYERESSLIDAECRREILKIVIAATIDGVVTALDADTGELLWTYKDEPLLAGTLSAAGPIDIAGTSLKLMPTLDGRLFSYAQQSNLIEPLPITTETLLESTVRLGLDAVAGGKTISTVGIDVVTGKVMYKCAPDACKPSSNSEYSPHPILLIKRISNTIRAMDALIGTERWNLSTAELDLSLAGLKLLEEDSRYNQILLHPPDGIITSRGADNNDEWTTHINGHIVGVWSINGNNIKEISIFDPANIYTTHYEVDRRENRNLHAQSSLFYVGTTDGNPFIIQSPKSKDNLKKKMSGIEYTSLKEVTGQRLCSANTRELAFEVEDTSLLVMLREAFGKSHIKAIEDKSDRKKLNGALKIVSYDDESESQTCSGLRASGVALIGVENLRSTSKLKDGDYGYLVLDTPRCNARSHLSFSSSLVISLSSLVKSTLGVLCSGFIGWYFLWRKIKKNCKPKAIESSSSEDSNSTLNQPFENVESKEYVESLSANRLNIEESCADVQGIIKRSPLKNISESQQPLSSPLPRRKHTKSEVRLNVDYSSSDERKENEKRKRILRSRTISRSSLEGWISRFATEYRVDKIMGQGGFGTVFRATCHADDKVYAVKRIGVADNERARDRVLREARALANLDHPGIIRYFCTWEERPPKGFQEREDNTLLKRIKNKKVSGMRKKMPPVVGNTVDESWNSGEKPEKITLARTTSESNRGLAGKSLDSTSIFAHSDDWKSNSRSSSSLESSSSDIFPYNNGNFKDQESSSSVVFVKDKNDGSNDEEEELKIDIKNKAIIVETDNHELELRDLNEYGDCVFLYIVMQLCDEKTLQHWIEANGTTESRSVNKMKKWICQLADALDYIHDKGYIHRDLKPGNVFFSLDSKPNREVLKIGDLGLVTKSDGSTKKPIHLVHSDVKHTKNVGTRSYMSPEQLGRKGYTNKVDIFALGLVATELIIPFGTVTERVKTFSEMQNGNYPKILDEYPDAKPFLMALTDVDPSNRPSAAEILNHPFLQ